MNGFELICEKLVVSSELARDIANSTHRDYGNRLVKDAFKKDLWKADLNLCCSRGLFYLFDL